MLMMLTPSRPSRANTTTTTPRMLTPIATQRLLLLCGDDQCVVEKRFIQISEIQPVLVEIGEALRFVPNDFHDYRVSTICSAVNYIVDTL